MAGINDEVEINEQEKWTKYTDKERASLELCWNKWVDMQLRIGRYSILVDGRFSGDRTARNQQAKTNGEDRGLASGVIEGYDA